MKSGSVLLVLILACWHGGALADVTASVDRSVITEEDSLTLTLTATAGEDMDSTDFSALEAYFNIGARNTQSQYLFSNGRAEESTKLTLTLFPLHTGNLEIPPLFVDGTLTPRIPVRVEKARTTLDAATEVFVETEVDREEVYVQAQLLLTIRSYQAVNTGQWNYEPIEIPGAVAEELDSRQFQRSVKGRPYLVIERRFAIFPQQSGELLIPSFSMAVKENLRSGGGFFNLRGNPRIFRPKTQTLSVRVRPIPTAFPDAHWLPARALDLDESWSTAPDTLGLGDSTTRTLTIKAQGVNGSQLPQIAPPQIAGIKAYPDQPHHENLSGENGITGLGITSAAMLVTSPGSYRLPTVRVPWWDTEADELRFAEIPARDFEITANTLPGQAEVQAQVSASQATAANTATAGTQTPWFWATLAALGGWLLTTIYLLARRRPATPPAELNQSEQIREPQLFKEVIQAANENRAAEARHLLQQWARQKLGRQHLPAIGELVALADDPQLRTALEDLEQALYAGEPASWRGGELAGALKHWRKQLAERERNALEPALAPLYGNRSA
jgi:hypothetical protein